MIEDGARRALADLKAVPPYVPEGPCEVKVEFKETTAFDEYARKPGVEAVGERTVVSRAGDWWTAWRQFFLV
jgi:D-amino peptidase